MKNVLCGSLLALLMTGCALIPAYKTPAVETPPAWKNGNTATDTLIAPDWWTGFKSVELDGFMDQALAQNNDLRAALARIEQARANMQIAGASLVPTVSASGGADISRSKATSRSHTVAGSGPNKAVYTRSWNGGLDIAYELDLFGANEAGVEAAKNSYLSSIYTQQALALTTMADVANAYFLAINLKERVQIAQDNLKNAQDVQRIVDARFNAGASSALEVAQQRTVLASSEAALAALQAQEANAETALAVLLGVPPQNVTIKADTLQDLEMPNLAPIQPSTLLQRRPDIRSAEADLLAANANIGVARAAFYPTVNLGAGLGLVGGSFTGGPVTTAVSASSSLLAPIFSGGALEGQLALSKARMAELVEDYRKTVLVSFQEVEDALTAVKTSKAREQALKEAVLQARKSYDLSRQLYNSGAVDFQTLLNAQASLLQTQDNYASVRLEMLEASVDLYRALGGGWQSPDQPVTGPVQPTANTSPQAEAETMGQQVPALQIVNGPALAAEPMPSPAMPTASKARWPNGFQ